LWNREADGIVRFALTGGVMMRFAKFLWVIPVALHLEMAQAQEPAFEPLQPMDLESVDPDLVADMFGGWTIRDESGKKACGVELLEDMGIGGMQIDVDPACEAVFPMMGDITAWRLLEGWAIDLVDAERKTRIRFSTPDERYVAFPEVDGIFTIESRQSN
jgi:hypothetical protein